MSQAGTLPQAELLESPADLFQAPDDVPFDTLDVSKHVSASSGAKQNSKLRARRIRAESKYMK